MAALLNFTEFIFCLLHPFFQVVPGYPGVLIVPCSAGTETAVELPYLVAEVVFVVEFVFVVESVVAAGFVSVVESVVAAEFVSAVESVVAAGFVSAVESVVAAGFVSAVESVVAAGFVSVVESVVVAEFVSAVESVVAAEFVSVVEFVVAVEFVSAEVVADIAELQVSADTAFAFELLAPVSAAPVSVYSSVLPRFCSAPNSDWYSSFSSSAEVVGKG
jgi:hypothetical protein